ncbi:MAG TPA: efflux RND transporter periplasmic adaptor subunit [Bryobacteraceae bacterium]|nr:efflux RND transporter periplasmic adaptor subunit [Bryobacteraceae bacterium]
MPKKILLLIAACWLATCACSKKEEESEAEPVAIVQVAPVRQESIHRLVTADGVLYPLDQANVVPKISAPVQRFLVNRGDHVRQGQLLAVLDNRDLSAAVTQAKGQLDQAEANYRATASATVPEQVTKAQTDVDAAKQSLDAAQKLLESRQKLFQEGALARKLVDEAQVGYAQAKSQYQSAQEHLRALQSVGRQEQVRGAEAQVEAARGQFESAQAQLAYSEIRSPISGVISDRPLYTGEMASAGSPLVTVMNITRVVARINVPHDQAGQLKVGDAATLTSSDSSQQFPGKVTVVSPATDPNATTIQVWVEANNPGGRLKPGASVRAVIVAATIPNAVVVPLAALLPGSEGGTAVMVVTADSVAHEHKVEVGAREQDRAQILSGVSPGDRVVVVGGVGLEDKAKVQIQKPGEDENGAADEGEKRGGKEE